MNRIFPKPDQIGTNQAYAELKCVYIELQIYDRPIFHSFSFEKSRLYRPGGLWATENFMNLQYACYLQLPIRRLPEPRKLFNVDGTQNKAGVLEYYTDLNVQTGGNCTYLCFFLLDLGENKAILGYPWFAAVQPKINWKRGWIDYSQLPIVF